MSDRALRLGLIRLAHEHPESRKDLLPILANEKEGCGTTEGPVIGRYEKGKPADPTEKMSPDDAALWEENTERYKDKFKAAKTKAIRSGLIRLAHEHPEFRKDILPILTMNRRSSVKTAGKVVVRQVLHTTVHIASSEQVNGPFDDLGRNLGHIHLKGHMVVKMSGSSTNSNGLLAVPEVVRFNAIVLPTGDTYTISEFNPQQPASTGELQDIALQILQTALLDALESGNLLDKTANKHGSKTAGMTVVRHITTIAVRTLLVKPKLDGSEKYVMGQMSLDFGEAEKPDAVRFAAMVKPIADRWVVQSFTTQKAVSGSGADIILGVLRSAFQEALNLKGESLLGTSP